MNTLFFLSIHNSIYKIEDPLHKKEKSISLKNIESQFFLRHFNGHIIESPYENSNLFFLDATFQVHELATEYLYLSATNPGMEDWNIYFDSEKSSYVLAREEYSAFFRYSFQEAKIAALILSKFDYLEQKIDKIREIFLKHEDRLKL